MKIKRNFLGKYAHYTLSLEKEEVRELFCSEKNPIQTTQGNDKIQFFLFPHPYCMEDSFSVMPDGTGYYIYVGGKEINSPEDLEKILTEKENVPITEMDYYFGMKKENYLGFVSFEIKK
jgi:hypothetical protein